MFALWVLLAEAKKKYIGESSVTEAIKNENVSEPLIGDQQKQIQSSHLEIQVEQTQPLTQKPLEKIKPKSFELKKKDTTSSWTKLDKDSFYCTEVKPKCTQKEISELSLNLSSPDYTTQSPFDFSETRRESLSYSSGLGQSVATSDDNSNYSPYSSPVFSDDDEDNEDFSFINHSKLSSSRRSSCASSIEINLKPFRQRKESKSSSSKEFCSVKSELYTVVKPDVVHCPVTSVTKTQIPELVLENNQPHISPLEKSKLQNSSEQQQRPVFAVVKKKPSCDCEHCLERRQHNLKRRKTAPFSNSQVKAINNVCDNETTCLDWDSDLDSEESDIDIEQVSVASDFNDYNSLDLLAQKFAGSNFLFNNLWEYLPSYNKSIMGEDGDEKDSSKKDDTEGAEENSVTPADTGGSDPPETEKKEKKKKKKDKSEDAGEEGKEKKKKKKDKVENGEDAKLEKKEKKKKSKKEKEEKEEPPKEEAEDKEPTTTKRAQRGTSNVFALFNQAQIQEFKEPAPKKHGGNVFALFNQAQIQEFKEAFTMMDQDRDGILSEGDLAAIYEQTGRAGDPAAMKKMLAESPDKLNFTHFLTLFGEHLHGREADPKNLEKMIAEAPGQLNFTHFLTLFGEKLHGRDPEQKILEAMVKESPGPLNFTMFLSLFGDKLKGTDPESRLRDAFKLFDEEGTGKLEEEYVKDLLMNVGDQFNKDEIKQVWKEAPIEGGQLDYLKFVMLIKRGKEDE